ncbi:MAG: molybdenum cofactor biosynthesis protein B [Candidatus Bathyarchaeia archaeon]
MSETAIKHKAEAPKNINFAVIICSSSRYERRKRGEPFTDQSGSLVVQKLRENGHRLVLRKVIPDDRDAIQKTLMRLFRSRKVDAIITCGGTGVSPRDLTIEAVRPLLEKEVEGFGEVFRLISYQEIGSAAILTRALAGIVGGKVVFCIPGSPQSVLLALEKLILPEVGHIIKHIKES